MYRTPKSTNTSTPRSQSKRIRSDNFHFFDCNTSNIGLDSTSSPATDPDANWALTLMQIIELNDLPTVKFAISLKRAFTNDHLELAIERGFFHIVEFLIASPTTTLVRCEKEHFALALKHGQLEITEMIELHLVYPTLFAAADAFHCGQFEIAEYYISARGVDPRKIISLENIVRSGSLDCVKLALKLNKNLLKGGNMIGRAAFHNHWHIVDYFHNEHQLPYNEVVLDCAAMHGRLDLVESIHESIHAKETKHRPKTYLVALYQKQFQVCDHVFPAIPWSSSFNINKIFSNIVAKCDYETFEYFCRAIAAVPVLCPIEKHFDIDTVELAIFHNKVDILRRLSTYTISIPTSHFTRIIEGAIERGSRDTLAFLIDHQRDRWFPVGLTPVQALQTCSRYICTHNNIEILQWLLELGGAIDQIDLQAAAAEGSLDIIKYCNDNNILTPDYSVADAAAQHNQLELVVYFDRIGIRCSQVGIEVACQNNAHQVLRFMRQAWDVEVYA